MRETDVLAPSVCIVRIFGNILKYRIHRLKKADDGRRRKISHVFRVNSYIPHVKNQTTGRYVWRQTETLVLSEYGLYGRNYILETHTERQGVVVQPHDRSVYTPF